MVFILLIAGAACLSIFRTLDYYRLNPQPAGDAYEYYDLALRICTDTQPERNIWQSRFPALPLVLSAVWQITGTAPLALYLLGALLYVAVVSLVCLTGCRKAGFAVTAAALAVLFFQPLIMDAAHGGTTEPLFALLAALLFVLGFRLPEKPYFWMIPAALAAALLVLCKPEGKYFAVYALMLFAVYYYRNRLFSMPLVIGLLFCAVAGALSLDAFQLYIARNNLIPLEYRIGSFYFYAENLDGKTAFNDENRYYTLMTVFDWLRLHSPHELFLILLRGLGRIREVFDRIFIPGASILALAGLVRAGLSGFGLNVLFVLPLLVFYLPAYAFHTEIRFLLPFCCLGIPTALIGLKMLGGSITSRLNLLNRLSPAFLPSLFSLAALTWGSLNYNAGDTVVEKDKYPDQTASQGYIGTLLRQGRFEEAEDSLGQGLRRNPEWAVYYLERSVTRYAGGDLDVALESLDRAISLNPYLAEAYYAAYYFLAREGRFARGVSYLELSLRYRPEYPPIRKLLENIYATGGRQGKIEELCGKRRFGYYLENGETAEKALAPILAWNSLLQTYFPMIKDKKPVSPP